VTRTIKGRRRSEAIIRRRLPSRIAGTYRHQLAPELAPDLGLGLLDLDSVRVSIRIVADARHLPTDMTAWSAASDAKTMM
jgi:hypothetical protein